MTLTESSNQQAAIGIADRSDDSLRVRGYVREPDIERQVRILDGLPTARLIARIEEFEGDLEQRIREETLVYLIRKLYVAGDADSAWRIALILAGRVKGRIAQTLRLWRLASPESIAEESVEEIISGLFESAFDTTPKTAFWEVRFWVAFDRCMLTIVRAKRLEIDRQTRLEYSTVELGEDPDDSSEKLSDGQGAEMSCHQPSRALTDPVAGALIADALARLPSPERTAYILKHVAGMPEHSSRSGDGIVTISTVLGVSERTVRNYLRRAEQTLERWREGDDMTLRGKPVENRSGATTHA